MTVQQGGVPLPAIGDARRRTRSTAALDKRIRAEPPLPPALETLFVLIAAPVLTLETALDAHLTLREISILLGDVLDLLEENQVILQAADELYEAAFALQDARHRLSSCVNITPSIVAIRTKALHAALAGFRTSLWSGKPSARARVQQLAW